MLQKFIISSVEDLDILLEVVEESATLGNQSVQIFKNLIKYLEGLDDFVFSDELIFSIYNITSDNYYCYISITLPLFSHIEFRVFNDRAMIFTNGKPYDYCMIRENERKNKLLSREMNNLFSKFKTIIEAIIIKQKGE